MTESHRLEQAADWFDRIDEFNEQDKLLFAEWLTCADNQQAFNRIAAALGQPEVQVVAQRIKNNVTLTKVPDAPTSRADKETKDGHTTKTVWSKAGFATRLLLLLTECHPCPYQTSSKSTTPCWRAIHGISSRHVNRSRLCQDS